jgi:[ribosomal protein S5]-alanine N-acetyltransferase
MSVLFFETSLSNCRLRPWQSGDEFSLAENANNILIWNNLRDTFPQPFTLENALAWIEFANTPQAGYQFAIEFAGKAIGNIGLRKPDADGVSEFGYWLGQNYWGQGIATAAVIAMLAHIDKFTGVLSIQSPVYAWNAASIHILEKTGFVRIAEFTDRETKRGVSAPSFIYRYKHNADH